MRLLLVFTYQGRVRPYCSERALAFPWTEGSKAVQMPNGGQEVPEIALSVGSKLELLRAFVFAKYPYSYFPVHSRICTRMRVYSYHNNYIHIVHDRGAEGFAL